MSQITRSYSSNFLSSYLYMIISDHLEIKFLLFFDKKNLVCFYLLEITSKLKTCALAPPICTNLVTARYISARAVQVVRVPKLKKTYWALIKICEFLSQNLQADIT